MPPPGVPSALDFTCNYFNLNSTVYDATKASENNAYFAQVCQKTSALGCCFSNGIFSLTQAQLNQNNPVVVPPCLQHYLYTQCAAVDHMNFCFNGSVANTTTLLGQISVPYVPPGSGQKVNFPNMYDKNTVLQLQALVMTAGEFALGLGVQPYIFNALYPFQIQYINFEYYNGSGVLLTPSNGSMYYPPQGDYQEAVDTSGKLIVTYQIVVQNVNSTEQAEFLQTQLSSPTFNTLVSSAFMAFNPATMAPLTSVATITDPVTYPSQLLPVPAKDSAAGALMQSAGVVAGLATAVLMALTWI